MIQQCSSVVMLSFLFLDWTLCTGFPESRIYLFPATTPIPTKCTVDVNCTGYNCPRQKYPFCEPYLHWSACGCTECTDNHHCNCPTGMIGHCRDDIFQRKCECKLLPGATCKSDSDCITHVCTGNLSHSFCHEKRFLVYDFSSCDCRECTDNNDCNCQTGMIGHCRDDTFQRKCECKLLPGATCKSDSDCSTHVCTGNLSHSFCHEKKFLVYDFSSCDCRECTDNNDCKCPTGMIGHCRDDTFQRKCECKLLTGATCKSDSDCGTHVCTGNLSHSFCHEKRFLVYDFSSCDCRECSKDSDCHCQSGRIPSCRTTAFGNTCHCNQSNVHSTHSTTTTTTTTTKVATTFTTMTPLVSSDPLHESTTQPTQMTSMEVTKSTTDSTPTPQSTNTTIPENNTSPIMVTLTTKPQGVSLRQCNICGDSPNSIPCDIRSIYMGNLHDCAPGEDYCMTDLIHNGQTFPSIYKRCVTEEECRNKWLYQTSNLEHCTNYGNVLVEGHYSCHFCCTSNGCNSKQIPDNSTLYIKVPTTNRAASTTSTCTYAKIIKVLSVLCFLLAALRVTTTAVPVVSTTYSLHTRLICPECDANLTCEWNQSCYPGEVCMLRQYHMDPFTVHCSKKQDCLFMKRNMIGTEILCCEDHQCITAIINLKD